MLKVLKQYWENRKKRLQERNAQRDENANIILYFNERVKLFEGSLRQYERVTGHRYEKLGHPISIELKSVITPVTDYHRRLYREGVEALVNCHHSNEEELRYSIVGGLIAGPIEGIPVRRLRG